MIKFYKCTYDEYQYIWLKQRIEKFLIDKKQLNQTLEQLVEQFLFLNENQNREVVEHIMKEIGGF